MDTLVLSPGLKPKSQTGLILGVLHDRWYVFYLSKTPETTKPLPESLPQLLNLALEDEFTYKDWILEHALQTHKLLVPSFQILGLFTSSSDTLIDQKSTHALSSTISTLLKRFNKFIKSKSLIHLHFEPNRPTFRVIDYENNKNFIGKIKEEGVPKLLQIDCKLLVWVEGMQNEVGNVEQLIKLWKEEVEGMVVKVEGTGKDGELTVGQRARVYGKQVNRVREGANVRLKGWIHCKVVVIEGTNVKTVQKLLKQDMVETLANRYSVVKDNKKDRLLEEFKMPRRVFAEDQGIICDYISSKENIEDCKQRIESILDIKINALTEPELQATELQQNPIHPRQVKPKISAIFIIIPILLILLSYILMLS